MNQWRGLDQRMSHIRSTGGAEAEGDVFDALPFSQAEELYAVLLDSARSPPTIDR